MPDTANSKWSLAMRPGDKYVAHVPPGTLPLTGTSSLQLQKNIRLLERYTSLGVIPVPVKYFPAELKTLRTRINKFMDSHWKK
jgi:hypothetical protein